jgi:hypothetical protein
MKLIGYEYIKIFSKKLALIIVPLLILANVFLYYQQQIRDNEYIIKNNIRYYALENIYRNMPIDKALNEISNQIKKLKDFHILITANTTDNAGFQAILEEKKKNRPNLMEEYKNSSYVNDEKSLLRDLFLYEELYTQLTPLTNYKDYLNSIQNRANEMLSVSIFHEKGTFSYRNIIKTPKDFEHLKNIPLEVGLDKGIVSATQFSVTDILIVIAIFLLCIYLFLQEKESGLIKLIRTNKKGRVEVAVAKLIALISLTIVLAVVFYGSIIIMANYLYGFGDLSRYVQCMAAFRQSNILLTVGQYLNLFLAGKVTVCVLSALIFSVLFVLINNASKIYLCIAALLGYSYISYVFVHPLSHLNLIKYINIIYFFNTYSLLGQYKNINFFGYPIHNLWLVIECVSVLFIILPVLSAAIYIKNNSSSSKIVSFGIWNKLKLKAVKPGRSIQLINHEVFKALFTGKGYIIILIALLIGYSNIYFKELRFNQEDAFYNSYLKVLSGELNEEKVSFIENENNRFAHLSDEFASIRKDYSDGEITLKEYNEKEAEIETFALRQGAFQKVLTQYKYLLEVKESKGLEVGFVNRISSEYLFNNHSRDIFNGLIYVLLLILGLSVIFPIDYKNGMISILRCTKNGRFKLFACKHIVAYIIAFILMVIIYTPQYINLIKNYNVENWGVPVQSIMIFREVAIPVSVFGFIILCNLLQFMGTLILTNCVLFLSLVTKRLSLSIMTASAFFICPILIQSAGIIFLRRYSFNNIYLMFMEFSTSKSILETILYYMVLVVVGICISALCWNKYNHNLLTLGVRKE